MALIVFFAFWETLSRSIETSKVILEGYTAWCIYRMVFKIHDYGSASNSCNIPKRNRMFQLLPCTHFINPSFWVLTVTHISFSQLKCRKVISATAIHSLCVLLHWPGIQQGTVVQRVHGLGYRNQWTLFWESRSISSRQISTKYHMKDSWGPQSTPNLSFSMWNQFTYHHWWTPCLASIVMDGSLSYVRSADYGINELLSAATVFFRRDYGLGPLEKFVRKYTGWFQISGERISLCVWDGNYGRPGPSEVLLVQYWLNVFLWMTNWSMGSARWVVYEMTMLLVNYDDRETPLLKKPHHLGSGNQPKSGFHPLSTQFSLRSVLSYRKHLEFSLEFLLVAACIILLDWLDHVGSNWIHLQHWFLLGSEATASPGAAPSRARRGRRRGRRSSRRGEPKKIQPVDSYNWYGILWFNDKFMVKSITIITI